MQSGVAIEKPGVIARFFRGIVISWKLTTASFRMVLDYPKVLLLPALTLLAVGALVVTPLSILVWAIKHHPHPTGRFFSVLYFVTVNAAKSGNWSLALSSAVIETYILWSIWMIPVLTAVLYFATVGMHVATQQIRRQTPNMKEAFGVANQSFWRIVALAAFSATVYAW